MSVTIQMCPGIKCKILLAWKLVEIEMIVSLPSLCLQDCFVRILHFCGTSCTPGAAFS